MKIAFIGFGEAGRAFLESLLAVDPALEFCAYDILLDTEGMEGPCARAMRARGVRIAAAPAEAVAGADWIFSAVTADRCIDAARAAAPHLSGGQVFFDINSVSPERKREAAGQVAAAGAAYVDMAVMAPVHPKGHATATLLAGPLDAASADMLDRLGFSFEVAGKEAGAATAVKMVRSVFVKGLEAITVEALLAAAASGHLERVLASLDRSYPGLGLPDLAPYQFERTLKHGKRRAAEMRESAATLDALGLNGGLAEAIADAQEAMGAVPADGLEGDDLAVALKALLDLRRR